MAYDRVTCPICETENFDRIGPLPSGRESWEPPPALRCRDCGLAVETHTALPRHAYDIERYDAARDHGAGADRWSRFHHDSAVAVSRLEQLKPFLGRVADSGVKPLWLDLGCGSGAFLTVARRRGWRVLGVEADDLTVHEIASRLGIPGMAYEAWCGYAQTAAAAPTKVQPPNVISGYDFLEHMLDPVDCVKTAVSALTPGGLFVAETPDLDKAEDFGTWRHRRISRHFTEHVTHWSASAFRRLADVHLPGAKVEAVREPVPGKIQVVIRKR